MTIKVISRKLEIMDAFSRCANNADGECLIAGNDKKTHLCQLAYWRIIQWLSFVNSTDRESYY